jgi:hypothetical protein
MLCLTVITARQGIAFSLACIALGDIALAQDTTPIASQPIAPVVSDRGVAPSEYL